MKKLLLSSIFACAVFAQAPAPQAVGGALQQSTLDTINYLVSHSGGGSLPTGCTSPGTGAITCTGTVLAGAFGTGTSLTILSTPATCAATATPAANTVTLFRDSAASNVLSMKISAGTCSAIGSTSTNGTSTQLLTSDGAGGYGTAVSQLAVVPQVFYPESYGALRNNSHDDTTAIQAAITAAAAVHGTVRLQAGTYKTTAPLTFAANQTTMEGAGHYSTIISDTSTTTDIIQMVGTDANCGGVGSVFWATLKGFQITRTAQATAGDGIHLVDGCYVFVSDIYSFNSINGLYVAGSGNTHIEGGYYGWNTSTALTRNGIFLDSSVAANNSTIIDSHPASNGGSTGATGLLVSGACIADLFVQSFETSSVDIGVHIVTTLSSASTSSCNSDLHLQQLILDTTNVVGVLIENVNGGVSPHISITDSHLNSSVNGAFGVKVVSSYGVAVTNSQFIVRGTGSAGLYLDDARGFIGTANIFQNNTTAIWLHNADFINTFTGNVIQGTASVPTLVGINFDGNSQANSFVDNVIFGDAPDAIGTGILLAVGANNNVAWPNLLSTAQITTPVTDGSTGSITSGFTGSSGTACTIQKIVNGYIVSATCP